MYKIHHTHNSTDICYPDTPQGGTLFVHEIGHSTPPPGYRSNPNRRNLYMLHYIISGRGCFFREKIEGPCIMLGTPEEIQQYSVDDDPAAPLFEQYWILFGGSFSSRLMSDAGFPLMPRILPCPYISEACGILRDMQSTDRYIGRDDNLMMIAGLYQLMSLHAAHTDSTRNTYSPRVRHLIYFMHENYASFLTEDTLAESLHLSTRYMHRIFKTETGVSPIQYLNTYRIHCAKKLLEEGDIPIGSIASACGFATHNYFCTVFRKYSGGLSPTEYRGMHQKKYSG